MTGKHILAWCAALLAGAPAGCSGDPPPAPAAASATSRPSGTGVGSTGVGSAGSDVVDCAHDIGGRPPDTGSQLVLDAVALPTALLDPQASGESGRLFAKQGLLVRAGRAVELTVAAPGVTIGWGSPGPEGVTIRVPACPSATGWLAFAGGYTVSRPGCVPLIVRVGDREQRAEVSVGVKC